MKQEVYTDLERVEELKVVKNEIDPIHDWVFHFNAYNKEWSAIHREVYNQHWNGYTVGVAKHNNIDILISLIRSKDITYKKA